MGTPTLPGDVSFGAPLPDPTSRYIYIRTPQPGVPLLLCCLGQFAVSCLTHWLADERLKGGGRTVPHLIPDDTCPVCVERNQRPRWHAFLACWDLRASRYVMADITVHAAQTCPALDPASGIVLRGKNLILKRIGTSRNSPVKAELADGGHKEAFMPASFDVIPALARLWGCTDSRYWRTSITPPKQ